MERVLLTHPARLLHVQASEKHVASVEWDAEGWHYCDDAKTGGPLTAQYVFVLDALNFCFWPEAG